MQRNNGKNLGEQWNEEDTTDDVFDPQEYELTLQLERLESIEEDMIDLGVESLADVRRRIAELHAKLDTQE
jgi:hypothetical protein